LKKKVELDRVEANIAEFISMTFNSVTFTLIAKRRRSLLGLYGCSERRFRLD